MDSPEIIDDSNQIGIQDSVKGDQLSNENSYASMNSQNIMVCLLLFKLNIIQNCLEIVIIRERKSFHVN